MEPQVPCLLTKEWGENMEFSVPHWGDTAGSARGCGGSVDIHGTTPLECGRLCLLETLVLWHVLQQLLVWSATDLLIFSRIKPHPHPTVY